MFKKKKEFPLILVFGPDHIYIVTNDSEEEREKLLQKISDLNFQGRINFRGDKPATVNLALVQWVYKDLS